jgi:hypothetical protein
MGGFLPVQNRAQRCAILNIGYRPIVLSHKTEDILSILATIGLSIRVFHNVMDAD